MRLPRAGLGARMALALAGSLTVLLALLGFLYTRQLRQSEEALIQQSEDRLGDIIRRSTRQAMLRNDHEELATMLAEIGRQPQTVRVRIYDRGGVIRYSSLASEVGAKADLSADACNRCHASAEPLKRLERQDRLRIYRMNGQRVMGMIHPIPNEPECGNASCHVHAADQAVLGVLDVQMSLSTIDAAEARRTRSFLLSSLLGLVVICAVSVLVAWRTVHRPVHHLLVATRAISAGHLDQRVPDRDGSELSELVRSFNQMTADLQAARRESDDWARRLEQRVEEKSEALRRAQDEMVQVEKMASLGELAAIVAHEINNPLAGIRTYAKLLMKKVARMPATAAAAAPTVPTVPAAPAGPPGSPPPFDPQEAFQWLSRIESESARCGEIVRNLLSFSRGSRPRMELTELNGVIRQTLQLMRHQLDLSGISGTEVLVSGLPMVECDPQQLKQALLAMLINACEAMPQGGQLTVESRRAPGEPEAVEIGIQDTGVGMDPETQKHVFEPFFTTKDGTASGGTGLGLAVVYTIVRSHGGTIVVDSVPGRGSRFVLTLPCRQTAGDEEGVRA